MTAAVASVLGGVAAGLRVGGLDATPNEIMDALWLSVMVPAPARGAVPARSPDGIATAAGISRPAAAVAVERTVWGAARPPAGSLLYAPPCPESGGVREAEPQPPRPATRESLADPLGVGRALRSLRVQQPSAHRIELDETATAERRAEIGWWEPVLRPRRVRWPDVAVIVDCVPSTFPIWEPTVRRLGKVLERLGAFRELRWWHLQPARGRAEEPRVSPDLAGGVAGSRPARSLAEPTGRRLLLVVTDGASRHWGGAYPAQLDRWARTNPVAVVSLVPTRLWPDGGLRAVPGMVMGGYPLQPNGRWRRSCGSSTPIPVSDLNGQRLEWLATSLSTPSRWTTTALLDRSPRGRLPAVPTPDQAALRFRCTAAPRAVELLTYLSAGPLLEPMIDRVCRTLVPDADGADLQEILLSGLVEPAVREPSPTDAMALRFPNGALRAEFRTRLHRDVVETIRWDLRAHARDHLGWEPGLAGRLLDAPDDPDLLRSCATGARGLSWEQDLQRWDAITGIATVGELSVDDLVAACRVATTGLHLAVAGLSAPQRLLYARQLTARLAAAGVLRSDQVRTVTATELTVDGADPAAVFDEDPGAVLVEGVGALVATGVTRAAHGLAAALGKARPGQVVMVSGMPGHLRALRSVRGPLAGLIQDDRVHELASAPHDLSYVLVRGHLRHGGPRLGTETAIALWRVLAVRHRAAQGPVYCEELAREVAAALVVRWQKRTGGDPAAPAIAEDLPDTDAWRERGSDEGRV